MRCIYIFACFLLIFTSCIKITSNSKRWARKVSVRDSQPGTVAISGFTKAEFKEIMRTGKLLLEREVSGFTYIIVQHGPGKNVHFFVEEHEGRRINVYKLSKANNEYLVFDEKMARAYPAFFNQTICDIINNNQYIPKSFNRLYTTVVKKGGADQSGPVFYKALYLAGFPSYPAGSKLLPVGRELDNLPVVEINITPANILFNPHTTDSIYAKVGDSLKLIAPAKSSGNSGATKPETGKKPDEGGGIIAKPAVVYDARFTHSCDSSFNFLVELKFGKQGNEIAVRNITGKKTGLFDTTINLLALPLEIHDIAATLHAKPGKLLRDSIIVVSNNNTVVKAAPGDTSISVGFRNDTVKVTIKARKPGLQNDSVTISMPVSPVYTFTYDHFFDAANFSKWLRNYYPGLDDNCAGYLSFKASQEILLHDTAYFRYRYSDTLTRTDNTSPKKEEAAPAAKASKKGSVFIMPMKARELEPVYTVKNLAFKDTLQVYLQVKGDYDTNAAKIILTLEDSVFANNLIIQDSSISISEEEWKEAVASGTAILRTLRIKAKSVKDTLDFPQKSYMVIKGRGSNGGTREILLNRGVYNPNKPFWVEFGANFDLLDGVQSNNLYAGIFMHKKDIASWFGKSRRSVFSLFGGIYESKTTSSSITSDSGVVYRDGRSFIPDTLDRGYPIFRDTGIITSSVTVNNLGLFISPQIRLTNGPAESNGLHLFASFWAEMLWQKTEQNFDYSKTGGLDSTAFYFRTIDSVSRFANARQASVSSDFRSHYLGFGLPVYLKENDAFFYLNPVIGFSSQNFVIVNDALEQNGSVKGVKNLTGIRTPKRRWNPFFLLQFRLSEERYGLSVTGEVRGLLIRNSKPFISIALSKKFDISSLLNF